MLTHTVCGVKCVAQIREHSFASSDGVMSIVCESLAGNKSDNDKKTFNRIIKELLPVLNNPDASSARLGFALQGLGKLAGCIKTFLGDAGFAKIEDRLKSYGENLLALSERATAMKWSIASQYLECVGMFVHQVRTRTESDMMSFGISLKI